MPPIPGARTSPKGRHFRASAKKEDRQTKRALRASRSPRSTFFHQVVAPVPIVNFFRVAPLRGFPFFFWMVAPSSGSKFLEGGGTEKLRRGRRVLTTAHQARENLECRWPRPQWFDRDGRRLAAKLSVGVAVESESAGVDHRRPGRDACEGGTEIGGRGCIGQDLDNRTLVVCIERAEELNEFPGGGFGERKRANAIHWRGHLACVFRRVIPPPRGRAHALNDWVVKKTCARDARRAIFGDRGNSRNGDRKRADFRGWWASKLGDKGWLEGLRGLKTHDFAW